MDTSSQFNYTIPILFAYFLRFGHISMSCYIFNVFLLHYYLILKATEFHLKLVKDFVNWLGDMQSVMCWMQQIKMMKQN